MIYISTGHQRGLYRYKTIFWLLTFRLKVSLPQLKKTSINTSDGLNIDFVLLNQWKPWVFSCSCSICGWCQRTSQIVFRCWNGLVLPVRLTRPLSEVAPTLISLTESAGSDALGPDYWGTCGQLQPAVLLWSGLCRGLRPDHMQDTTDSDVVEKLEAD